MNDDISFLPKEKWPTLLHEIPDGPEKLHLRGALPSPDTTLLCVVGSRKFSSYGKAACEKLIAGLHGKNVAIISGLAFGIDGIAHEAALANNIPTVAVPGSGLNWDVLYPRAHYQLGKRIIENGGAHLSEFAPDHKARPESFPQRNRIMAGMSHMTLIIEANEKSGTLITARLALEYNRDVGVVPASIFSDSAKGSNELMRQGAFPITSVETLCEILEIEENEKQKNTLPDNITAEEKAVLELLDTPKTKDELLAELDLPAQQVNVLLSGMEIKGFLREEIGQIMKTT